VHPVFPGGSILRWTGSASRPALRAAALRSPSASR